MGTERATGQEAIPRALRWLFFVIGVGSLMASGIYLDTAVKSPETTARLLRAVMFLLNGLFWMLMYGEQLSRGRRRGSDER